MFYKNNDKKTLYILIQCPVYKDMGLFFFFFFKPWTNVENKNKQTSFTLHKVKI